MSLLPPIELSAQLWDLRTQLEGQLRCLTKIHPSIDAWDTMDRATRAEKRSHVIKDLEDLIRMSTVVAQVATEARIVAASLPLTDPRAS